MYNMVVDCKNGKKKGSSQVCLCGGQALKYCFRLMLVCTCVIKTYDMSKWGDVSGVI